MTLIADILLVAGALGAALYCMILSRKLGKFNDLEQGMGGAVAMLSVQVDDMTKTLKNAQNAAGDSSASLEELTRKADDMAKRLELLMAAMHDLPEAAPAREKPARPEPKPNAAMIFQRHSDSRMEAAE